MVAQKEAPTSAPLARLRSNVSRTAANFSSANPPIVTSAMVVSPVCAALSQPRPAKANPEWRRANDKIAPAQAAHLN